MKYHSVVGIDSSPKTFGIAKIFLPSMQVETVNLGKRCKATDDLDRYRWIAAKVKRIVDYDSLVIMEDYAYAAVGQWVQIAGTGERVRDAVRRQTGSPPLMVAPGTLKKWITGNGRAQKDLMLLKIFKTFGKEFDTTDEAEAYALATIGLEILKHKSGIKLSAYHNKVLKGLNPHK